MSDEFIDSLKKIDEKMDTVMVSTKAAQDRQDKLDTKFDGLDVGALKQASTDVASAMQDIQDMKQEMTAISETAKFMEKSVARLTGGADDGDTSDLAYKTHNEFCSFLRKGDALSPEVEEAVLKTMVVKNRHGVTEAEIDHEVKTMMAGSDPEGGYFIPGQRSATMIKRIFETSPVRMIANVETTSTDSLEFIIDDDEADSGGWIGEVDSRGETGTPKIGKLTIPVHEQFAQPLATQKMIDDAGFDIEGWLSGKVTSRMGRVENTAFVTGDGSEKPRGFLTYPAWVAAGVYQRGAIEQIASGATAAFTGDALKGMQNAMIEEYQANAKWTTKRASFEDIITLKDGSNRYIFQSRFIDERDQMRLLGREIVFMNDMPDVAADSLSLAYADWQQSYTVVDRLGFRVIRDIFTKKPFIKFYTTKRVGGDVTNYEAIKIMKMDA